MVQYHVQVVVAGMVVTKALCWPDLVPVFGLLVTDFVQSDYDHFGYDHLYAAPCGVAQGCAARRCTVRRVPARHGAACGDSPNDEARDSEFGSNCFSSVEGGFP